MKHRKAFFLSFSDIVKSGDPFSIKNYMQSGFNSIESEIPLRHPFACDGLIIGICSSGHGRIKIDYTEYEMCTNSITIIFPGHIFQTIERSSDFRVEILLFSVDFFANLPITNLNLANGIGLTPYLEISVENTIELLNFHRIITEEFERNKKYKEEIIKHLLIAMLLSITEFYAIADTMLKSQDKSRDEEIKETFMKLLVENKGVIRDPDFFSDKIFITTKHLSTVLKRVTGRSLNSWMNESIIIKAKMLIKSTNTSIAEISEELNFPNPSFFSKYFKKHTGITPMQYKKS